MRDTVCASSTARLGLVRNVRVSGSDAGCVRWTRAHHRLRHGTLTVPADGARLRLPPTARRAALRTGGYPDGVRFVTDISVEDLTAGISRSVRWRGTRNAVCATCLAGKPTSKTAFCARSVMQTPDFRRTRCASCADCALQHPLGFATSRKPPLLPCGGRCIAWTALPLMRIREELTGLLCGRCAAHTDDLC